jgi:2-iminobutanoate/2-iminopropanoate deaminase
MPGHPIEVPVLSDALAFAPLSLAQRAGDFVYVSGMPPFSCSTGQLVPGDIRTQTEACLLALDACLEAAGATRDDVVNVRIYCANVAWFSAINQVYAEHFGPVYPSRTFVPVASWPAEFDIEIDCVAYLGASEPQRAPQGDQNGRS